jgi:hypothetical protein
MAFGLATVMLGLEYERLSVAYWENLAAHPPAVSSTPSSLVESTPEHT